MRVDDIYEAAISGNIEKLIEILETDEVEFNKVIDGGVDEDGYKAAYTIAFSILGGMEENIRYDVLDVLVERGMSFDTIVQMEKDGCKIVQPLLQFAISALQDPVLTKYMLEHGANPNSVNRNEILPGYINKTNMLWYAITGFEDTEMMELLLSYGADPEKCCEVYLEEQGVYQYLPPLFYTLVECGDIEKTACLFRYGASPQCAIDVGAGFRHNTDFRRYIKMCYPQLEIPMKRAFDKAQKLSKPQVKGTSQVPKEKVEKITSVQNVLENRNRPKLQESSNVTSLEKCYGKFTAYLFMNFAMLTVAFGIIAPMIIGGRDPEAVPGFLVIGIGSFLISASIWSTVSKKAKKRGQTNVMGEFVMDGFLIFIKVLLCMTIFLIPLAKTIGDNREWENKKTVSGRSVTVRRTSQDGYEDAYGNRYHKDDSK